MRSSIEAQQYDRSQSGIHRKLAINFRKSWQFILEFNVLQVKHFNYVMKVER